MNGDFQNNQQVVEQTFMATDTNISQQPNFDSPNATKKPNGKKISLILVIVALVLIISGFGYFYYLNTNPVKVYQHALTSAIDNMFGIDTTNYDKANMTFGMSAKLDVEEGVVDQEIIDMINKTSIKFNFQMDVDKEQLVLKLDSDYDKESLIDLEMFLNSKEEKTYIKFKDFFDKYIEVEMDEYETFSELFKEMKITSSQRKQAEKAKNIIKKEISKIITKEDCSKEDGKYVFKITEKELVNRLKDVFTNLKNNKEFLNCYEDSDTIKSSLEMVIEEMNVEEFGETELTIAMKKGLFSKSFDELSIKYDVVKLVLTADGNNVKYQVIIEGIKLLNGYVKNETNKNTEKLEISLNVPTFGSATLYFDSTIVTGKDIETINSKDSVKLEELTDEELEEIGNKIQDSMLYGVIEEILNLTQKDDNYEDDSYIDSGIECTGTIEYDGVSVDINVPSKFEGSYCTEDYASYYNDDVDVTYEIYSYESYTEYFEEVNEWIKYDEEDEEYQNRVVSSVKTKTINGTKFHYMDYTYDYEFLGTNHIYEKYLCTEIEDGYYLIVEIESWDTQISDSLLESLLDIE